MNLSEGLKQNEIKENIPRHSCGHCGNEGCADLIASFTSHKDYDECLFDYTTWKIYYCPLCNDITLEKEYEFSEDYDIDHNGNTILNKKYEYLYPLAINNIDMSHNMPDDLSEDYAEAQAVAGISPRSAAALLRLLLERLCTHYLSESHPKIKKLDGMIGVLVKEGVPEYIQKACDILRITGNETVHAGTIDIRDDPKSVISLFELVNMVADYLHIKYKKITELYEGLPEDKRIGIENRDKVNGK
jgi:hypothetical protein